MQRVVLRADPVVEAAAPPLDRVAAEAGDWAAPLQVDEPLFLARRAAIASMKAAALRPIANTPTQAKYEMSSTRRAPPVGDESGTAASAAAGHAHGESGAAASEAPTQAARVSHGAPPRASPSR